MCKAFAKPSPSKYILLRERRKFKETTNDIHEYFVFVAKAL